ncbi:response regulator [Phycisphaera mikurensis]|uniref:OmpR family two-component system response regulator n=1 Tax=Phycisphaera mikurensis (strain NBRC 102666 / KCTC 22515 / FYK2301M01) TaxID=1142394 RepID=I0IHZ6_PHYMF|nr:response regulator transcription factor [Phycisphaera mikurensis]MBB6442552.1 two-component system phosphate regulon response regulator PhoB [Phycisphaera mikurensis]BAM04884.1 OmpR family two-component system response regulator [Phycisphaera mikurensis NBRC 102666]
MSDPAPARILLVEDELDLLELLRFNLEREGYDVVAAQTGAAALAAARAEALDLVLLDRMLPGMEGLEICRTLRKRTETARVPIIMLTAKGEEADVVKGLEAGADDYVTKPFSPRVLLARIRAVLRRGEAGENDPAKLSAGGVSLDRERHAVTADGEPVDLTATEFKLLALLLSRPGRVFTRQQIIERIHEGFAAVTDRSVDVQVVALRRKLLSRGDRLETVRGVGYRFAEDRD